VRRPSSSGCAGRRAPSRDILEGLPRKHCRTQRASEQTGQCALAGTIPLPVAGKAGELEPSCSLTAPVPVTLRGCEFETSEVEGSELAEVPAIRRIGFRVGCSGGSASFPVSSAHSEHVTPCDAFVMELVPSQPSSARGGEPGAAVPPIETLQLGNVLDPSAAAGLVACMGFTREALCPLASVARSLTARLFVGAIHSAVDSWTPAAGRLAAVRQWTSREEASYAALRHQKIFVGIARLATAHTCAGEGIDGRLVLEAFSSAFGLAEFKRSLFRVARVLRPSQSHSRQAVGGG